MYLHPDHDISIQVPVRALRFCSQFAFKRACGKSSCLFVVRSYCLLLLLPALNVVIAVIVLVVTVLILRGLGHLMLTFQFVFLFLSLLLLIRMKLIMLQ